MDPNPFDDRHPSPSPAPDSVVAAILAAFTRISGFDAHPALASLFSRFACWVDDLPASERNHHARPYGLLDHSLDTARLALLHWEKHAATLDSIAPPDPDERALWIAAATATALLHDVGKICEFDLAGWDPVEEPLADYRRRHPGAHATYRPGRGWDHHDFIGNRLLDSLLDPDFPPDLAMATRQAYEAYSSRADRPPHPHGPWPLPWIAAIVVAADRRSSADDFRRGRKTRPLGHS